MREYVSLEGRPDSRRTPRTRSRPSVSPWQPRPISGRLRFAHAPNGVGSHRRAESFELEHGLLLDLDMSAAAAESLATTGLISEDAGKVPLKGIPEPVGLVRIRG